MSDQIKKPLPPKNDGSAFVWGGTILVASAIVGFCVYVALSQGKPKVEPAPAPAQQQAELQPRPETPAPVPQVESAAPRPQAQATPPAPAAPQPDQSGTPQLQLDNLAGTLRLHVPFLDIREKMPLEHTCYRNNMSPAISWQGAPAGTQSFVVFLERRTPPQDEPFVNWVVFDIPAGAGGLDQGQPRDSVLPNGARHATSDHNNIGYIGPCDSKGSFTYALRVFALDTVLGLGAGTGKHDLIRAMNGHIIDAAEREFTHYYRL